MANGGREASVNHSSLCSWSMSLTTSVMQVEQYEVLVGASGIFYSFSSGPSVPQNTGQTMDIVLVVDDSDSVRLIKWGIEFISG